MYSKSDNIEVMINDEADDGMKVLSDSLKNRNKNNLESMEELSSIIMFVYCIVNVIKLI